MSKESEQYLAKTILLSDGSKFPVFGLGTWESTNKEEITDLIRAAFDCGYRHIDTAQVYGNEKMIGEALKTIFNEGKYKREDIYIVSKAFPYKDINMTDAVKTAVENLQIKYLDLFYLHWPFAPPKENLEWNHKPVHVSWAELERAHELGLTKSLGVSNFTVQGLVDLLSYAKVKPVTNQVELHVFLQQPRLIEFCNRVKVHVTAYSPMARYNEVVKHPTLKQIAEAHGATISQVLLAFLLNQNISVIPKTTKISRLKENFDAQQLKLTSEEMSSLRGLNSNFRTVDSYEIGFLGNIPNFN